MIDVWGDAESQHQKSVHMTSSRGCEYIRQSYRKMIGVVWAVRRRPREHACRQIMDMEPVRRRRRRGRPDGEVNGCCGQAPENGGTGRR